MVRLRALLRRSPGVSALAAMLALVAIAWMTPTFETRPSAAHSRTLA